MRVNVADATPPTVAVTVKLPTFDPAVRIGAVATPEALLIVLADAAPPAKLALDPTLKRTMIPCSGFPLALRTVACRGMTNGVFTTVLWPEPLVAAIDAGATGAILNGALVAGAKPGLVAWRLWLPDAAMLSEGKVAMPVAGSAAALLPKRLPMPETKLSVTGMAGGVPPAGWFAPGV